MVLEATSINKTKVLSALVSGEASLPGLITVSSHDLSSVRGERSSSYKDTIPIRLECYPYNPHLNSITPLKALAPNAVTLGIGAYEMKGAGVIIYFYP